MQMPAADAAAEIVAYCRYNHITKRQSDGVEWTEVLRFRLMLLLVHAEAEV
jgi:hypothetical protein